jgi:signal peptide peptidase SppA
MKLQDLIQQIYYEPSLITPAGHASIRRIVECHLAGTRELFEAREPGQNICGDKVEVAQMVIDEQGIAHIPIGGAIGKNLTPFDRGRGAVDVNDVSAELRQAEGSSRVRGIILDFDSPGGMVAGTPELAKEIERVKKPIYAFTDGMMASAAYWLGSASDGIFSTLTASVGSIGVYIPWIDQTKAFEMEGLKVELIKAGKLKGMGFPGTELTAEQRAFLQERVDEIYSMFKSHVVAHRPGVKDESMQGQTFMGTQAYGRGLVDAIVRDKGEVAALI